MFYLLKCAITSFMSYFFYSNYILLLFITNEIHRFFCYYKLFPFVSPYQVTLHFSLRIHTTTLSYIIKMHFKTWWLISSCTRPSSILQLQQCTFYHLILITHNLLHHRHRLLTPIRTHCLFPPEYSVLVATWNPRCHLVCNCSTSNPWNGVEWRLPSVLWKSTRSSCPIPRDGVCSARKLVSSSFFFVENKQN